jgi:hypothetical protein
VCTACANHQELRKYCAIRKAQADNIFHVFYRKVKQENEQHTLETNTLTAITKRELVMTSIIDMRDEIFGK